MDNQIKNQSVHYKYIICILIAIIIGLITKNFGQNDPFVSYVSFAATLASLILAILAIVQSMISYASFGESSVKINDASENLSKNTILLSELPDKILQSMRSMESRMEKIDSGVNEIKQQAESLNQKIDSKPVEFSNEDQQVVKIDLLVDYFLKNSSVSGLMLLYAAFKAKEKNRSFNLRKLTDILVYVDYNYAFGFLVAAASSAMINFTKTTDDDVSVTHINQYIVSGLYARLQSRAKEFDEENSNPPHIKNEIEKIEQFFE